MRASAAERPRGALLDLDGTVYEAGSLVRGASRAIGRLRRAGFPFLFTTNTSRKSRAAVVEGLGRLGLRVEADEVLTAPVAAARFLAMEGLGRVQLLLPAATREDFARLEVLDAAPRPGPVPDAVVIGDMGSGFDFVVLNAAFRSLRAGARLVAIHRNRWWLTAEGETMDAGGFVAALEYAAGTRAVLVGKPAPAFFELAAGLLGLPARRLVVVGDDSESDVRGARAAGLAAFQVRTGKFDPERASGAPPEERPDAVLDSIAELPAALGLE